MIELKSTSGEVAHSGEFENIKECLLDYLYRNSGGSHPICLDLEDADLRHTDLNYANLSHANLNHTDLNYANLNGADLRHTTLNGADLRHTDLSNAKLNHANLSHADLNYADLNYADLRHTTLNGAKLTNIKRFNKTLKHFNRWDNLYKYDVEIGITTKDEVIIKMGCFTRSLEEWEDNFWNNDNEFPNDNSTGSNKRLKAFEFARNYVKDYLIGSGETGNNKPTTDKDK